MAYSYRFSPAVELDLDGISKKYKGRGREKEFISQYLDTVRKIVESPDMYPKYFFDRPRGFHLSIISSYFDEIIVFLFENNIVTFIAVVPNEFLLENLSDKKNESAYIRNIGSCTIDLRLSEEENYNRIADDVLRNNKRTWLGYYPKEVVRYLEKVEEDIEGYYNRFEVRLYLYIIQTESKIQKLNHGLSKTKHGYSDFLKEKAENESLLDRNNTKIFGRIGETIKNFEVNIELFNLKIDFFTKLLKVYRIREALYRAENLIIRLDRENDIRNELNIEIHKERLNFLDDLEKLRSIDEGMRLCYSKERAKLLIEELKQIQTV